MAHEKAVKRFGPRYGRTVKHNFAKIESQQRSYHICPFCHAKKVKRLALGIWACKKCDAKFTGKAFTIQKQKRTRGQATPEDTVSSTDIMEELETVEEMEAEA